MQSNAVSEYGFAPTLPDLYIYKRMRYKVKAITFVTIVVSRKAFLNTSVVKENSEKDVLLNYYQFDFISVYFCSLLRESSL